jgi:hypothetical protein
MSRESRSIRPPQTATSSAETPSDASCQIRPALLERLGRDHLVSRARDELALLERVDVHRALDLLGDAERREEGDGLGAPSPHDHPAAVRACRVEPLAPGSAERREAGAERTDLAGELRGRLLERQRRCRDSGGGPALDEDVLVVVVELEVEHIETGEAVQPRERPRREVRAVLVVDVPERHLTQHAQRIGELEEHRRVRPPVQRAPDDAHEVRRGLDVLEGVPADDGVARELRVALGVVVGDQRHPPRERRIESLLGDRGIDADRVAHAELDHVDQEAGLAAADLEHVLAAQSVPLDPPGGQITLELAEAGREGLRLLVGLAVVLRRRIVRRVGDEPAARAEAQLEVTRGELARRRLRADEPAAVDRDPFLGVEAVQAPAAAVAADPVGRVRPEPREAFELERGHRISGVGTGTMKRPPPARYSACWRTTSSL